MFTAAALRSAETYLDHHLVANDYYCEHEAVKGKWIGRGAAQLGIEGDEIGANDDTFEAIRTNRMPDKLEPLTQRTGSERIAFYDFQVSAPKSVSVLAVTFGDDRLRRAHESAVEVAFRELENYAARRVRSGGKSSSDEFKYTGNLTGAAFTHDASRALDAQLHTHLVCANATYDRDERQWYALQNREMFSAIEFAGRVYQNELARGVREAGYAIRQVFEGGKMKSFEIEGVTADDMLRQSTRRLQIEREIDRFVCEKGRRPTIAETHIMATSTRCSKLAEISTPEVRAAQLDRYSAADRERLSTLVRDSRGCASVTAPEDSGKIRNEVASAIDHISERSSVFDYRSVLTTVLRNSPGRASLDVVRRETAAAVESHCVAVGAPSTDEPAELAMLSTRKNLAREVASIAMVDDAVGKFTPLAAHSDLPADLSDDQRRAVSEILRSRDGVVALRGPAGTGKTTALQALDRAVKAIVDAAGIECVFVAPTHQAKDVLQRDGFANAQTIASLLVDIDAGRLELSGKMLVVDEAGMQSTRDGRALLAAAQKAKARVLFVGDEKQLSAVDAGDFMAILARHSRLFVAQLSTIFRQRQNPEYLTAMKSMAEGKVKDALAHLDRNGWIHEAGGEYLTQAANAYCAAVRNADDRKGIAPSVLLVAPTWREIDQLTTAVRHRLALDGRLSGPEIIRDTVDAQDFTTAQRRKGQTYEPGMVITPANRACLGLSKGQWYPIRSVSDDTLTLTSGKKINVARSGQRLIVGRKSQTPIRVGDRLLLQGNDRAAGLTNGMRGYVTAVSPSGEIRIRSATKSDEHFTVPASYQTLTHGYAMTVHASQGETVDRIIGAVGQKISGQLWNVLSSRGRREVAIYVPERKATIELAQNRITNRAAAIDYVQGSAPGPGSTRLSHNVHRQISALTGRGFSRMMHAASAVASRFRRLIPPQSLDTDRFLRSFGRYGAAPARNGKGIEV